MKEFCKYCKTETWTHFNDFMVGFCKNCKRMRPRDTWTPQAFICMYCEGGYDESYPGQRVCNSCQNMPGEF